MACSEEFIEFVCSQIEGVGMVRTRKMFGDWCIYIDERPVILACDNTVYVKMNPAIADLMADAETGFPYEGAKEHYILDVEHSDFAKKVLKVLVPLTPLPKKKKKA
ncbi:MAG: TfoX/Sxy family protein [Bacteroidaceae bacterium]|nr:TfoX/Sxy family protein [Bacteroidaceae bacterium]